MTKIHDKKTKILHILGSLSRGGAESRTVDTLRQLDPQHYEVHFATKKQGPLLEEIQELGGTVHYRPLKKFSPVYYSYFKDLLTRERFDVVHSHIHYASGYYLRLAEKTGVPIRIAHFRAADDGNIQKWSRRPYAYLMQKWIDQYATNILAVSHAALDTCWPREKDKRCQVVYNGLDTNAYRHLESRDKCRQKLGYTDKDVVVIHVGRHDADKNYPRILEVFTRLREKTSTAKLLMVGIGEDAVERDIDNIVKRLGIGESVQRTGLRADVPDLVGAADMMLFPSFSEGLPGAVLEACILGIPTLGSDIPGIREIATHFPNVYCVSLEEGNSTWITTALKMLDHHPACNLDWNQQIDQYEQSPFNITACMNRLCNIWQGSCPDCIDSLTLNKEKITLRRGA